MNHVIYDAITNVSDDLVDEAIATKLRKPIRWQPYTALAACLALVIAMGTHWPANMGSDSSSTSSSSSSSITTTTTTTESAPAPESAVEDSILEDTTTGVIYTAAQLETLTMTLISWDESGFLGTVVTGDESGLFPEGADLSVIFDGEEPYPEGATVTITFYSYEEYVPDKGFVNRVYADSVEVN